MRFDTKIAIVLHDELEIWQKLNVTAFLTSGIIGKKPDLIGETYEDRNGILYSSLNKEPVIVLAADFDLLKLIHKRAVDRSVEISIYIKDMFATGDDEANRETVAFYETEALPLVGLALREERKIVDKITKGTKLHS